MSTRICIKNIFLFFTFTTIVLAKVVTKYIIVSLLCHKSIEFDDNVRVFLFHSTHETYIDESAPSVHWRVHEKSERSFKGTLMQI